MPSSLPQSVTDSEWTYTLGPPLGRGGFATVYEATMERGGVQRRVAMKVLKLTAADDPEAVARLRDEAAILGRLEHHAIVRVLGVVDVGGLPAVVMDLVDGIDLRRVLACAPISGRVVCQLGADIADALDAAWSDPDPLTGRPLHVVHRDIKPANVLITRRGAVRLVDFGVARASLDRDGTTQSQHQFGTVRYMAPERFDNEATHRSDVYALGVTLIEAYTGTQFDRLPVRPAHHQRVLAARLQTVQERGGPPEWRLALVDLLGEMLHYEESRRPDGRAVARRLSELADLAGGESARRVLPGLVAQAMRERAGHRSETLPLVPLGTLAPAAPASGEGTDSVMTQERSGPLAKRSLWGLALTVGLVLGGGLWWMGGGASEADRLETPKVAPLVPVAAPSPGRTSESVDVFVQLGEQELELQSKSVAAAPVQTVAPRTETVDRPDAGGREPTADVASDTMLISFRLSVGGGGTVVIDSVAQSLPFEDHLALGLHAVTFRHHGHEKHMMVYVGSSAPTAYVFDSTSETVHALD